MQVVLKTASFIRPSAQTHRQFKSFVEGLDNDELLDNVLALFSEMVIGRQYSWKIFSTAGSN